METDDRRSIHEIDVFGSQRKLTWIPRDQDGFRLPNPHLSDPPIQKETPRFRNHKAQETPAKGVPNSKVHDYPARGVSNDKTQDFPARGVPNSKVHDYPARSVSNDKTQDFPARGVPNSKVHDYPASGASNDKTQDIPARGVPNSKVHDSPARGVSYDKTQDVPAGESPYNAAMTAVPVISPRKGESVRRLRPTSGNLSNGPRGRSVSPHPYEQSDSSQGDSGESDGQKDISTRVLLKPGRAAHDHAVHTITEEYDKEQEQMLQQSEQSPAKSGDSSDTLREMLLYSTEGPDRMSNARNSNVQDPRSESFSAAHTKDDETKTQIEAGCAPTIPTSIANRKLGLRMGSQVAPVPENREPLPTPPLPSEPQADKPHHTGEPRVALSPLNGNEELTLLTPSTNGRKIRQNSLRFDDDEEGDRRRSFSGFGGLERGNGLSKRFPSKSKLGAVRGNEIGGSFRHDVGSMSQRIRDRSPPGRRDSGIIKPPQPFKRGIDKDEFYVDRRQLDSPVRHPGARARGRSQRIGEPGKSLLSEKSLNGGSKRYSRGSQSCRCQSIASPMFHPGEEDESFSHIKTIVLNSSSEPKKLHSLPSSVSAVSSDSSVPQSQDLSHNHNREQFPFPTQVEKWKQPSDVHFSSREKLISESQRLDEKCFLQEPRVSFSASKAFDQDIYSKLVVGTGIQDQLSKSGRAPSRTSSSVSQSCSMMTRRGAPRSASPAAQLRRWIVNHFTSWSGSKDKIKNSGSKSGTGRKSGLSKEGKPAPANSEEKAVRKQSPWRRIISGRRKKKKNSSSTAAKAATVNFTPEYPGLHQSMRFVSARFDNDTQPSPVTRIAVDPQTQCRMTPVHTEPNATPSRRWMFVEGNGTAPAAPQGHRLSNVEGVGYSIHTPAHRLYHMEGNGYSNPTPGHRMNRRENVGYSTPSRRMMMYADPELQGDFYEPHLTAFSVADTPTRSVNGTPGHRLVYLDNDGYITPAHRFSHREAAVGYAASPGPAPYSTFIEPNGNATPAHRAMFVESNGNATPGHRAVFVDGNGNVTPAHGTMYVETNGNATPTQNHRTAYAEIPGKPNPQAGSAYRKAYMLPPIPIPSPAQFHAQRVY